MITRRTFMKTAGASILPPTGIYAGNQAMADVTTVTYKLDVAQWPEGFSVSVGLLSDIHLGVAMDEARLHGIVSAVNAMDCDVVALLGDYIDAADHPLSKPFRTNVHPHSWGEVLSRIEARSGIFGIAGNHDWKHGMGDIRTAFEKAKLPLLENDVVSLCVNGQSLWVTGLGSQWGTKTPYSDDRIRHDDVPRIMRAINTDAPVLMLMHEPDIFDALPARFAVAVAGHTHGGQVNLPLIGRPIPQIFPKAFSDGKIYGHIMSPDKQRHLIVTSGVGCSGIPVRIGVPPEIVRLELRGMRPS